ncbi:MAG: sialate O-acetylesterase [Planctomycetes bacterium]|nr:sialate O-acetylesterase [Planctomycetota bacterium]
MIRILIILSSVFYLLSIPSSGFGKTYHVYYLGGQSNMDGYGTVNELPSDLKNRQPDVPIYHGSTAPDGAPLDGRGIWAPMSPGHGVGFTSDGESNRYSNRFGVELSFAKRLQQLYPNRNIAIIKYSRGGTSIDREAAGTYGCWEADFFQPEATHPEINQYDHFLATVRGAFTERDIDGDGKDDVLIPSGIVWMQGESDAEFTEAIANRYSANLKRLMDLIRAALRTDDLPVAVGRISDSRQSDNGRVWDYGDIIRREQARYSASDSHARLVVSTDDYGYCDPWHYDSAGYLDLGVQFANALHGFDGS